MGTTGTLVMGILNLTPDSFSDGGRFTHQNTTDPLTVLAEARRMVDQGAHILDLGAESTRPGAEPVSETDEQRRLLPALTALLAAHLPVRISVDTRHPATAHAALTLAAEAGTELIINDISGILTHPQMPQVVAEHGCEVVITHNRGDAQTMQSKTDYDDVVADVITELHQIRSWYLEAGVPQENIILDPGIGFAKTHDQNWELVRGLNHLVSQGHRVLFGASRKGFLGTLLAEETGTPRPPEGRDTATAVLSAHAASAGCWAVRVHTVEPSLDAIRVAQVVQYQPA
ncbi:dihydropteroate synthase [Nesterenkonia alba]|uniref:dihydropteroate synthase n=1 Tax=Nesterenkonia alba TaxID=515814 RepID=UPI0003B38F14|nr:dihydropteroate synthase [Nesterenkonia alba]